VHTEENQNKSRPGPKNTKIQPGQQVASNRAMHCNMKLVQNEAGEYDAVVDRMDTISLIRGEYIPIGKNFHYPKVWGRKYAATKLLEHIIRDKQKIIQDAQSELEKLQRCMDKVNLWNPSDQ
jgi:hypothetical protein